MPYELIIFDCDGTLVDSESLYNVLTSEMLTSLGLSEYTPDKCAHLFCGRSWDDMSVHLEEKHGVPIPDEIVEEYTQFALQRMETEIMAIPDALHLVERSKSAYKICVASNGECAAVRKSLEQSGFMDHFHDDHIFTKALVERGKPAPDLFLHAAEAMGTAPQDTLVIEDSISGVEAALAANMDVIAFTGAHRNPVQQEQVLRKAGAEKIIDALIHIPDKLQKLKS